MCFTLSPLVNLHRWNWDGDRIVHECIVPSSRPVVGRAGRGSQYDIDVREFLVTERNEVMRRTLREDLPKFARRHRVAPEQLTNRAPGSFDLTASMVGAWVAATIRYATTRGRDPWQFPDETLSVKSGDCEDRALLIASLLLAAGISNFNVRVALGRLELTDRAGRTEPHDHAWVMYKTESGRWTVLEPFMSHAITRRPRARSARSPATAEYVPLFLFNDAHLWQVAHPRREKSFRELTVGKAWRRVNPKFAGDVHRSIVSDALDGIPQCPAWLREGLMRHFTSLFGTVVDEPDNFVTSGYDCFDHFDNAFIDEGWAKVNGRLASFQASPQANIDALAWAVHGIADFYAHSSYGEFGPQSNGKLAPYPATMGTIAYDAGPYALSRFSVSAAFHGDSSNRAALWAGQLISGRYCQHKDSRSVLENLCPTPKYLNNPGNRALLPHHDEIAIDGPKATKAHVLYKGQPTQYAAQFALRKTAATEHIRGAIQAALPAG